MAKKIEHAAGDKHMTLVELSAFVADAFANGATGTEEVGGAVTFRAKLRTVSVHVTMQPEGKQPNEA